jgi:hypothetical protein
MALNDARDFIVMQPDDINGYLFKAYAFFGMGEHQVG